MFIIGFMLAGYIGISKLYHMYNDMRYSLVTNNPWFFIALTTMVLGTQLFLAGFLGEIILRTKNNEERYRMKLIFYKFIFTEKFSIAQYLALIVVEILLFAAANKRL
jgi:hypothetical protein